MITTQATVMCMTQIPLQLLFKVNLHLKDKCFVAKAKQKRGISRKMIHGGHNYLAKFTPDMWCGSKNALGLKKKK